MSIFEPATIQTESPEMGQDEVATAEAQEMQDTAQEPIEETQVEAGADEAQEVEEQPSDDTEQGNESQLNYEVAYRELRRDYTRKAQELAELKRGQVQSPAQQVAGQGQPDMSALTDQFWEEFQRDPVNVLFRFADSVADQRLQNYQQQVEQMVAPIYESQAAQAYAKNMESIAKIHPELRTPEGYQQFNEKVHEIVNEVGNPNLIYNTPKRILDMAAKELFGDTGARLYQKAKAQGKEEALNAIRTKQGLSTQTGTKPKEQPVSLEDQVANSIVGAGRKGGIFG